MTLVVAVQHDELPAAEGVRAAVAKWRAIETALHGLGLVVIAGHAQYRLLQVPQNALEAQIAAGIVLDQITGDEDGGVVVTRVLRTARQRIFHHGTQTRIGFHAAQNPAGVAVQMRIGDV